MRTTLLLLLLLPFVAFGQRQPTAANLQYLTDLPSTRPEPLGYGTNALVWVTHGSPTVRWKSPRLFTLTNAAPVWGTNFGNSIRVTTNASYLNTWYWVAQDASDIQQDPRWWLAKSDSSSDDTSPIQAALTFMGARGYGSLDLGGRTNVITSEVAVPPYAGIIIENGTIDASSYNTAGRSALAWEGTSGSAMALITDVVASTNAISIANSGLVLGDRIRVADTNTFSYSPYRNGYKAGEDCIVVSATASKVTLASPVRGSYSSATAKVWKITSSKGGLRNVTYKVGTQALGPRWVYGRDIVIDGCTFSGTQDTHIAIDGCMGVTISGCRIVDIAGSNVGLNYGILIGYSQGIDVTRNSFLTRRHTITAGDCRAAPSGAIVLPCVNRDINVSDNIRLEATEAASVDVHGNTEGVAISRNFISSGVTVAGNRIRIFDNPRIGNTTGGAAISCSEQTGADYVIARNNIEISFSSGVFTWGIAWGLANVSASYGGDTNKWTGDVATGQEEIQIVGNTFRLVNPPMPSGGHLLIYVGESGSVLTTSTPWTINADVSGNVCENCTGETANTPSFAAQIIPNYALSIGRLQYSRNRFGNLGALLRETGGVMTVDENFIEDGVGTTSYGVLYFDRTALPRSSRTIVSRNVIRGVKWPAIPMYFNSTVGQLSIENNVIENWRTNYAISGSAASMSNVTLRGNTFRSTSDPLTAWNLNFPSARVLMSNQRYETNGTGTLGRGTITASSLVELRDEPTITTHTGQPFQPDFIPIVRSYTNLVDTQYTTNNLRALDSVFRTVSINNTPSVPFAIPGFIPLYLFDSTNADYRTVIQQSSAGTAARASLELRAVGGGGTLTQGGTNEASSPFDQGRLVLLSTTGAGLTMGSQVSTGVVALRVNAANKVTLTNDLLTSIVPLNLSTSTNLPVSVLTKASGSDTLGHATLDDLKNAMGISIGSYQPANPNLTNISILLGGTSTNFYAGDGTFKQVTTSMIPGLDGLLTGIAYLANNQTFTGTNIFTGSLRPRGAGTESVNIGNTDGSAGNFAIAIGYSTKADSDYSISIGEDGAATAAQAIGIGLTHTASGIGSVAIGPSSTASATASAALGSSAVSSHATSTAIGASATTTATHQIRLGTSAETVSIPGALEVAGNSTIGATNIITAIGGKSDLGHTHTASDIVSGTMATARLGSGSATSSTFLRGDQTWAAVSTGPNPTYQLISVSQVSLSGTDFTDEAWHNILGTARSDTSTNISSGVLGDGSIIKIEMAGTMKFEDNALCQLKVRIGSSLSVLFDWNEEYSEANVSSPWNITIYLTVQGSGGSATVIDSAFWDFSYMFSPTSPNTTLTQRNRGVATGTIDTGTTNAIGIEFYGTDATGPKFTEFKCNHVFVTRM